MYRFQGIARFSRPCCLSIFLLFTFGYGTPVGNWVSTSRSAGDPNIVDFGTGGTQKVRIYVCTPTIVRVSLDDRGTFTSTKDVLGMADINRTWDPVSFILDSTSEVGAVSIITSELKVRVQKSPFRIGYFKPDNTRLMADTAAMNTAGTTQANPSLRFTQGASEHYFGWGLSFSWFRTWRNIDNKNTSFSGKQSEGYYMYSTGGYGIFLLFAEPRPPASAIGDVSNNVPASGFDLRGTIARYWMSPSTQYGWGPMEYLSYFFIEGNWQEAMSGYTAISGRPPRLGKKFYGIMRDCYIYNVQPSQMKSWVDMWRGNRFNMDWARMDNFFDWGNFGYLPNPSNPADWNDSIVSAVDYYHRNGLLFGGMMFGWGFQGCCSGYSKAEVDTNNAGAHATTAVNNGFDWAWYDAMNFHSRSNAQQEWNVWKAAHGGDETKVMVSRGWLSLSSQSWPGAHMGDYLHDNGAWLVFPSALVQALDGYAWSHTDLGEGLDWNYIGLALRPMICFHQAGAAGGNDYNFPECTQINTFPADLQNVIRRWGNVHYQFIPYLFTYGMIAHETGVPVWRGMMCQNGGEQVSATYPLNMECYVGEELIVSPYYPDRNMDGDQNSGARHNIYLPTGVWYDYFQGTKYTGPTTISSYPCDPGGGIINKRLPLFVKANAIIPLMDTLQWVGEKPESLITVQVWPSSGNDGSENGSFTLYEDEGTEVTPPSRTVLASSCVTNGPGQTTRLSIGAFSGSRYCTTAVARKYRLEIHNIFTPKYVKSAGNNLTQLTAIADYNSQTTGWYWDASKQTCFINAAGDASTGFDVIASTDPIAIRVPPSVQIWEKVSITRHAHRVNIIVPFSGPHVVEVLNTQGRLITRRNGNSAANYMLSMEGRPSTVYLIRVSVNDKTIVKKMTF